MKNIFRIRSRWSQSKSILKDASYISKVFRFTGIKKRNNNFIESSRKSFFWFSIRLEKFRSNDHLIGEKKLPKIWVFLDAIFFSSTEFLLRTNFFVFPFSFDETLVVTKNIPKVHLLLIGRSFEFLIFCIFNFPHREAKIKLAYINTFNDLALLKVDDNGLMSSMCAADNQK